MQRNFAKALVKLRDGPRLSLTKHRATGTKYIRAFDRWSVQRMEFPPKVPFRSVFGPRLLQRDIGQGQLIPVPRGNSHRLAVSPRYIRVTNQTATSATLRVSEYLSIRCVSKKGATFIFAITLDNLDHSEHML